MDESRQDGRLDEAPRLLPTEGVCRDLARNMNEAATAGGPTNVPKISIGERRCTEHYFGLSCVVLRAGGASMLWKSQRKVDRYYSRNECRAVRSLQTAITFPRSG